MRGAGAAPRCEALITPAQGCLQPLPSHRGHVGLLSLSPAPSWGTGPRQGGRWGSTWGPRRIPNPQNHRQHWHTKEIFIESEVAAVTGGQRAAPRAPEQDGVHSTVAMEAKLNTAQPARGVTLQLPSPLFQTGKDEPVSFPQEITARGSLEVRKWPPVTAYLQLQQIGGVTWGQIQPWQYTPHKVSAKTVILKKKKKRYFSDSTVRRWAQPPPHSRQPQWLLEGGQQWEAGAVGALVPSHLQDSKLEDSHDGSANEAGDGHGDEPRHEDVPEEAPVYCLPGAQPAH